MRRSWVLLLIVAAITVTAPGATGAVTCDVQVTAPADLQQRLNQAGTGAVVCLSGTFATNGPVSPLRGQTIVGGYLRYSGTYDLCKGCDLNNGYTLRAGNITLRGVEVGGFEGRGVVCGPGSRIVNSYLHHNRQNAIACTAQHEDWSIEIVGNRIVYNGDRILEGESAGGVKLMELSRPGHAVGAGATIRNNVVAHNSGNGLWLDRSSNASLLEGNKVFDNARHGFRCEKCGGPVVVSANRFYDNGYEGIDFTSTGVGRIVDNIVYGNDQVGINVWEDFRARKTYPTLGDSTLGWHIADIRIVGTRLVRGGVTGCGHPEVSCAT